MVSNSETILHAVTYFYSHYLLFTRYIKQSVYGVQLLFISYQYLKGSIEHFQMFSGQRTRIKHNNTDIVYTSQYYVQLCVYYDGCQPTWLTVD